MGLYAYFFLKSGPHSEKFRALCTFFLNSGSQTEKCGPLHMFFCNKVDLNMKSVDLQARILIFLSGPQPVNVDLYTSFFLNGELQPKNVDLYVCFLE